MLPDYAELVENIEDADVVIADCTQINDAAELIIEDAQDAGKKLVILANTVDPTTYLMENGDAVLALTFSRGADGTGASGFITTTEPIMLAKLLSARWSLPAWWSRNCPATTPWTTASGRIWRAIRARTSGCA